MTPKISLCASANRIRWWPRLIESLRGNKYPFEVVFAGNIEPDFDMARYPELKWIYTTVKPAQAYQIAFWNATGELIGWTADDATYDDFSPVALDIAYDAWSKLDAQYGNDRKSALAMNPCEDGGWPQLKFHKLFGGWEETPSMAPFGILDREYFVNKLGGYDKHFVSGQSENDVIMRVYEDGGRLEICMDAKLYVHHSEVHPKRHNGKSFTPFRYDYNKDRERLENCWIKGGYGFYEKLNSFRNNNPDSRKEVVANISKTRILPFEPFEKNDTYLTASQGEKGQWLI